MGEFVDLLLQLFEEASPYPEKSLKFGVQGSEEFCCTEERGE